LSDDRLGYLASIVEDAASYRGARLERRGPRNDDVEAVVTRLGERIPVDGLASAAEVLVYVHPTGTRPFDPRYLARYQPVTARRRDGVEELDAAIDGDGWA
jgi:hypothetical protein